MNKSSDKTMIFSNYMKLFNKYKLFTVRMRIFTSKHVQGSIIA